MRRLLAYARPHTGALLVGTFLALVQPLVAKRVIDTLSGGGSLVGPVVALAARRRPPALHRGVGRPHRRPRPRTRACQRQPPELLAADALYAELAATQLLTADQT